MDFMSIPTNHLVFRVAATQIEPSDQSITATFEFCGAISGIITATPPRSAPKRRQPPTPRRLCHNRFLFINTISFLRQVISRLPTIYQTVHYRHSLPFLFNMSATVGTLLRRGAEMGAAHFQKDPEQQYQIPTWGAVIMGATLLLFVFASIMVSSSSLAEEFLKPWLTS
jgi:hypothetical protein